MNKNKEVGTIFLKKSDGIEFITPNRSTSMNAISLLRFVALIDQRSEVLYASEDQKEGARAFVEKGMPAFKGG